ncbi:hypothetical protein, partial [Lysinibacillus composti]|uniref:hypothetical protein n=1 Tax=Lysinibacillus composti TaxID=720633 RepID=UPI00195F2E64
RFDNTGEGKKRLHQYCLQRLSGVNEPPPLFLSSCGGYTLEVASTIPAKAKSAFTSIASSACRV